MDFCLAPRRDAQVVVAGVDQLKVRTLAVLAALLHLVYAAGWALMCLVARNFENGDGSRDLLVLLAAFIFGIALTQLVAVVKEHRWLISVFVAVNVLTAVVLMLFIVSSYT